MLGEIALYNFMILLLTGTYLSFFYRASDTLVNYDGSYLPLKNVQVSEAYSSVLHISFDVRGGLVIRQIHHWAALLFLGAILIHACRIFFTGAFRKPRDVNWAIGVTMLVLSILEGFCGYSLPDDLLSGTGLRIAYSIVESVPIVGSYAATFLFGGQYPGDGVIFPRMFIAHVFILPLMLSGLIGAHLLIVWRQKHTQFPSPEKKETNVVGSRLYPTYAVKSLGLLFGVFATLSLLAGYAQINPIWLYGPYDASTISAGSQPDWYMFWLEGSLRLMPNLETRVAGHTVDWNVLFPAVILPLALFGAMYIYPFLERTLTRDKVSHELLDRPRNHPVRTGLGVAALIFYLVLTVAGANDVIPLTFGLDMMGFTRLLQVCVLALPVLGFILTRRWCHRLQRAERVEPSDGRRRIRLDRQGYVLASETPADTEPSVKA
jgi:ubiquinol-cytochrome c reductase cytochrome b subunit